MPPSYLRYYHQPGKRARHPWFSRLLVRFRAALLLLYMFGSACCMFTIESVVNSGFEYAMNLIWLPLAILFAATIWFCRIEFAKVSKSRVKPWLLAALAYPVCLLLSWPYVMLWNALSTSKTEVTYAGPVIGKSMRKGYHATVTISDNFSQKPITLRVNRFRHETLSKNELYQETFYIGRLGLPYRWKFEDKPPTNL